MSFSQNYSWAEGETAKLIPQLVNIGSQLTSELAGSLGVTAGDASYWKVNAAVLVYAAARITAVRGYSVALTNWRDNILIDRTPEPITMPQLTLPPMPTDVELALNDPTFVTDFLNWCNALVKRMEKNGMTDADRRQLGFLVPPPAPPKDQLQAEVRSVHDHPHGVIVVNADRKHQPQVKATLTLDDGTVLEKTLPSAKIPFNLPTDRIHSFTVVVQYADRLGNLYGLPSAPFAGRSEL